MYNLVAFLLQSGRELFHTIYHGMVTWNKIVAKCPRACPPDYGAAVVIARPISWRRKMITTITTMTRNILTIDDKGSEL